MESKFMDNAYVLGEVRDLNLDDMGDRKNVKLRVNVYTEQGFVDVQVRTSRNAAENWAEKLHDIVNKEDIVQVSGSLDEYFYDGTYRRSVQPYVSNKSGWGDSFKIFGDKDKEDWKATARLAGDVIEYNGRINDDNETEMDITLLVFNTYNRNGDTDLTRKEVLAEAIQNFGDYAKKNNKQVDFKKLKGLQEDLGLVADEDLQELVTIYKEFKEHFDPLIFTISEFHLTVPPHLVEEMEEINEFDNITVGAFIMNKAVLDAFGFASSSKNTLEVGVYKGINESLGSGVETLGDDVGTDW